MNTLHFLYHTTPGRLLLKLLTAPALSRACGAFLDSKLSHFLVRPFARHNRIRLSDYEMDNVQSFNDFFSRKIRDGLRPIDREPEHLIAPCDGLLSVWPVQGDTVLPIKQSHYTLPSARYQGGYCLVFRLCVDHYHRYCYVDSGTKSKNFFIPGVLHTVRPVALEQVPVFTENSREYTLIRTSHFGTVTQMEVGAMLVGRIVNHENEGTAVRGKEKGFFQYGGSTIILLIEPDQARIRQDLLTHSLSGRETTVKMGEVIGHAKQA